MKISKVIFLFLLIANIQTFAQKQDTIAGLNNTAYQPGEKLIYTARYGFIKGGTASLSVDLFPNGDTWVYRFLAKAKTAGMAGSIFTLYDVYESYVEIESGLPILAIRNIHEQKYTYFDEVTFDRKKGKIYSKKTGEKVCTPNLLDVLSAYYYLRRFEMKNLKKDQILEIQMYFDDEYYPLKIRFKGYETIKSEFGKIRCMKFMPVVEAGRLFDSENDLKVWITDDNNKIPIKMQIDFLVGSLKCELTGYEGLKNEFKIIK